MIILAAFVVGFAAGARTHVWLINRYLRRTRADISRAFKR